MIHNLFTTVLVEAPYDVLSESLSHKIKNIWFLILAKNGQFPFSSFSTIDASFHWQARLLRVLAWYVFVAVTILDFENGGGLRRVTGEG